MQSLPLLSVVLASRSTQVLPVFRRAAGFTSYTSEFPSHVDEELVRTGLLTMTDVGGTIYSRIDYLRATIKVR